MQPFVKLTEVIKEFNLQIEYAPEGYELYKIFQEGVNRAALQLTGFFDNFDSGRVQLIGGVEHIFLEKMTSEQRTKAFDDLFAFGIPIIIFAHGMPPFDEAIEMAKKHNIVVTFTEEMPTNLIDAMSAWLRTHLGPETTIHGVLVEVYGEGCLLLGDSGVGKSETAIELIKRGHRLVADDCVIIKEIAWF